MNTCKLNTSLVLRRRILPGLTLLLVSFMIFFVSFSGVGSSFAVEPPKSKILLKFAHISDDHFMAQGPDLNHRLLKDSPVLLKDALEQIRQTEGIKFILFSGDFVNTPRPENFEGFFKTLKQNSRVPSYIALGNHDVGVLPKQSKADTLSAIKAHTKTGFNIPGKGYYSFSPDPRLLFIVLDGTTDKQVSANGFIPDEEVDWLKFLLRDAAQQKPSPSVFVTLHFPPVEPFHSKSHEIVEPDVTRLMNVLEAAPNVSAVFTGHYHSARIMKRNGIHYFSAPALVEYPNAFRIFTLYEDGTLQADWKPTLRKELQQKSFQRSPWPQAAIGNPDRDLSGRVTLRYFP